MSELTWLLGTFAFRSEGEGKKPPCVFSSVCTEVTQLPQPLPHAMPELAWPPQSYPKRRQEETGRGQHRRHLLLEKCWVSYQSNSYLWVVKKDRNRNPPCSHLQLTMTNGHRRWNSYWMATADPKSGCSAVQIGKTQWWSSEDGRVSWRKFMCRRRVSSSASHPITLSHKPL